MFGLNQSFSRTISLKQNTLSSMSTTNNEHNTVGPTNQHFAHRRA